MRINKYHNKKVIAPDGEEFDSRLEMNRWLYLKNQHKMGNIWDLHRQVPYELIPRQKAPNVKFLKTKTNVLDRVIERCTEYIADFTYTKHYEGPIYYIPDEPFYYFTQSGDLIPIQNVPGVSLEAPKDIMYWDGNITVVEDTKGLKTPDYVIKRKLMRLVNNIRIREVKSATEEI